MLPHQTSLLLTTSQKMEKPLSRTDIKDEFKLSGHLKEP